MLIEASRVKFENILQENAEKHSEETDDGSRSP
jgi:hypothetical protein